MILSSDQIFSELQDIWPDFEWEFPKNPYFTAMPDDMLERVIMECSIKDMVNIPHIWECENYSGRWQSNVEVFQYKLWMSGEYKPEWRWYVQDAFGIEHGLFGDVKHSKNIARLESGWILFEPQTDVVSKDFKSFTPILGEA